MAEYYVIKDKNTGLYFRGKGVNRWGKYFNQASIYRVKGMAKHMIEEISWRGEQAEVVPIHIVEATADVVEVKHGEWLPDYETFVDERERESEPIQTGWVCSLCGRQEFNREPYCNCGAKMDGKAMQNDR